MENLLIYKKGVPMPLAEIKTSKNVHTIQTNQYEWESTLMPILCVPLCGKKVQVVLTYKS